MSFMKNTKPVTSKYYYRSFGFAIPMSKPLNNIVQNLPIFHTFIPMLPRWMLSKSRNN